MGVGLFGAGCEGDSSPSHDFGDNDKNLYVAMGDSITWGVNVTPYPTILSEYLGKTVVNEGYSGEHAYEGARRVAAELAAYKPGYLLILYGANDLLHFIPEDDIEGNLRFMITKAKEAKTIPVIATLTPMVRTRGFFNDAVKSLNVRIRRMAKEEGVKLVDLERHFGNRDDDADPYVLDDDDYLQWDGLHPNQEGTRRMALAFLDAL
jgi:lysophospholipase L1-like esterase